MWHKGSTRLLCVPLPLLAAVLIAQATGQTLKIQDATAVRLSLTESLSSATNSVDDPVRFEVTEDVKVADVIAIPRGSTAVGHVVEVEPKRRLGRAGKLNFSIDHVKAPDGANVRLRASSARKGEDKTGTVIVGTVLLSPLFLIMRGKDVSIPKGTNVIAYVDGDREITLPSNLASRAAPSGAAESAQAESSVQTVPVSFNSTPDGADVIVDGKYAASTPSTLLLAAGDHKVSIEKGSFKAWERTITVAVGSTITVSPTLEKQ
jgi:hypothetical protein